jgi:hypothetical protein
MATSSLRSDAYNVLLLGLVATIAVVMFAVSGRIAGYFAEAIALEVRHGTLAESPLSVLIAAAAPTNPARLPVGRYLERARSALVIFEGDIPMQVELRGSGADLVWLDSGLEVREVVPNLESGEQLSAPARATFLLVLPSGYADKVSLHRGEMLTFL